MLSPKHAKRTLGEEIEVLTSFTAVTISQYMCVSNHHVVDLKLLQCCMSVISQ